MVLLDRGLIMEAHRLIDAGHSNRLTMLVFLYQESVSLHNGGHPRHVRYNSHFEDLLREYVNFLVTWRALLFSPNRKMIAAPSNEPIKHAHRTRAA